MTYGWTIDRLLMLQHVARDMHRELERAVTIERIRLREPIDWSAETTEIFHHARASDQKFIQEIKGLAWDLTQDKEYY